MRRLVVDKVALERGHLILAEQRRVRAAPHVPEEIESLLALRGAPRREKALAHPRVRTVEQRLAGVVLAVDRDRRERTVGVQRHAAVEQKVSVADEVHAAVREQKPDVILQPFRMVERRAELIHQLRLRFGQRVRIGRQNRRQMRIRHREHAVVERDGAVLEIDAVQHPAVVHMKLGVVFDDLSLKLEQDDRHRLVHLGDQLGVVVSRASDLARQKLRARIVGVRVDRKRHKRRKRDPVAVLDRVNVAVFQRIDDRRRDQRAAARRGAHPQDVVVAPLHVDVVVAQKPVQNDVRARTAVEHVAHDVQPVDDQPLNEVT